jgi:hypothetical protein
MITNYTCAIDPSARLRATGATMPGDSGRPASTTRTFTNINLANAAWTQQLEIGSHPGASGWGRANNATVGSQRMGGGLHRRDPDGAPEVTLRQPHRLNGYVNDRT